MSSMTAKRILVTGATGFVGGLLARRLLADGYEVRCLVREREAGAVAELEEAGCEIAVADLTASPGIAEALEGVSVAYFLVHMMAAVTTIRRSSAPPRRGLRARRPRPGSSGSSISAGSATPRPRATSPRATTSPNHCGAEGPPLTYFRAAMVIGPGSESYELLRGIVERLPVFPAPGWLHTKTQPIGASDVVDYLREALDVPESIGREIQIGGPQVVSHLDLVEEMASALGRRPPRRIRMSSSVARPATVAAGARAVTSGTPAIATEISLGLTTPTVVTDPSGADLFTTRPHRLDAVLAEAVDSVAAGAR